MKQDLNANQIKLIAIGAMTVDHLAWMLFPGYPVEALPLIMHILGRVTCPIMCYFVAEGFHYTKNINRYTFRMFLFALLSHFAYLFSAWDFAGWASFIPFSSGEVLDQTSVMWSLAWGLVMLRVVHSEKIQKQTVKVLLVILICVVSFPSDWSCIASLFILVFGTNRGNFRAQMLWMVFYAAIYSAVYFFAIDKVYGLMQMAVILAVPVLRLYNGKRGNSPRINRLMKWVFYLYYPLHLFLIGIMQHLV